MKLTEEAFQEFVDALETVTSEAGFERVASRVIRRLGFERFAYLRIADDTPTLLSSYPKSWTKRYFELRYQKIDPVVQRAAKEYDCVAGPAPCAARFLPNSINLSRVMSLRFTRPSEALSALSTMDFDRRTGFPT